MYCRPLAVPFLFTPEVDAPTPVSQYMSVASSIAFGDDDGAASHPLFPGGRGGEALHEGRCQGWDRAAATQPADQGSGGGDRNAAVSPCPPWRGADGGGRGFPARRKGDAVARRTGDEGGTTGSARRDGVASRRLHGVGCFQHGRAVGDPS